MNPFRFSDATAAQARTMVLSGLHVVAADVVVNAKLKDNADAVDKARIFVRTFRAAYMVEERMGCQPRTINFESFAHGAWVMELFLRWDPSNDEHAQRLAAG